MGGTPEGNYRRSLRRQEVGVPDDVYLKLLVDQGGLEAPKGPAGSVLFFDCNTLHGSASNISPFPRANVFLVYNALCNAVGKPHRAAEPRPELVATRERIVPLEILRTDSRGTP